VTRPSFCDSPNQTPPPFADGRERIFGGLVETEDGNVWFTAISNAGYGLGRMTPAGEITLETRVPTNGSYPFLMAVGPDRNVWFTEPFAGRIGRVSTGLADSEPGSFMLPSSALRRGAGGAEFHTSIRVLDAGGRAVIVTPTLYDQASGHAIVAPAFTLAARSQAAFDDALATLFGRTLDEGSYGPIRFDATGPIVVSSSVVNVRSCGGAAVTGQWLPGIEVGQAVSRGALLQIAVSADGASGKRSNAVFVNPGDGPANVSYELRRGNGAVLASGTFDALPPNGFRQTPLDTAHFSSLAGLSDTDLVLEFHADRPVLAFASVIDNRSGDPFASPAAVPDSLFDLTGPTVLPSAAFRRGANGAVYVTDVRLYASPPFGREVTAVFFDQVSGRTFRTEEFLVPGGQELALDNVLGSLFELGLDDGAYGPIRFEGGPVRVFANVNNVNACGSGATAGQWLPGLDALDAVRSAAIAHVSVSASRASGSRTNVVVTNPASGPAPDGPANVRLTLRRGDGSPLGSASLGPLAPNGFAQLAVDAALFPAAAGLTDSNLWLEVASDQPVLAFGSVVDNVSGDPFAVVAVPEDSQEEGR
jgi:hypothetical protein